MTGMMLDSPVSFPTEGALPARYPLDRPAPDHQTPEEGYYLFSTPERSLGQIAAIRRDMPSGRFAPAPGDWSALGRSRQRLRTAGDLHLLAMGDSIVNDTMRSAWLAGLQQAYPGARIRGTVYVRGGGGCQHYRDEDRVGRYVVPRQPDVVLLGGISQDGLEPIRQVIGQLRAGLPEVEILLTTGAFGATDPRDAEALALAPFSGSGAYGAELRALAAIEGAAYLDLTTPWAEYIRSSGEHPHRFYRDAVHANEFGEQILAEVLLSFWTAA